MPYLNGIYINEFELGYLVAMFEGEGFIALNSSWRKQRRRPYFTVHVGITNSNFEILEYIYNMVQIGKITAKKKKSHHKQTWNWRISKQREVYNFLIDSIFK